MMTRLLAVACGALALSTSARAEFFVGGAGGISDWPDAACSQAASSCDHRSGTWLVRSGYIFLPYMGLEARYMDLGRATSSVPGTTINSTPTSTDLRFESKGGAIGAIAALPLSPAFAFIAFAGAARLKTTSDVPDVTVSGASGEGTVTVPGFHAEETKSKPYFGVGVDYLVARNVSVGVEATRYRVQFGGTDNVDTLTASLTFRFR
jgi:hypothetical protein